MAQNNAALALDPTRIYLRLLDDLETGDPEIDFATKKEKVDDQGRRTYRLGDHQVRAGSGTVIATLKSRSEISLPEDTRVVPAGEVEAYVRAEPKGDKFATIALTITADDWVADDGTANSRSIYASSSDSATEE